MLPALSDDAPLPADALPADALPADALPADALPADPLPADPLPDSGALRAISGVLPSPPLSPLLPRPPDAPSAFLAPTPFGFGALDAPAAPPEPGTSLLWPAPRGDSPERDTPDNKRAMRR